jgi:hypothetical protein
VSVHIAGGFAGNAYPLDTPRIGWRRITGAITASSAAAGYAAANAATSRTDSFWQPTSTGAQWVINAGSAQTVNYIGVAAHDLGAQGTTIAAQSSTDGVTWTPRLLITPTDNEAVLGLFGSVSAQYWRVLLGSTGIPTIGVIQFGEVTEFPAKCVFAPALSFERTRVAQYQANITEGGQWAGRTRVAVSTQPVMSVTNLPEAWIAQEWDAFARAAETEPFFIADRPSVYARSVAYAWSGADLRAERARSVLAASNNITLSLTGFSPD